MFIDVTRYGGMRVMRMAVAAIAYLDVVDGGCAIHLIGGETVRVNEDADEIEARCTPEPAISALEIDGRRIEYDPARPIVPPPEPAPPAPQVAPLGRPRHQQRKRR